MRVRLKRDDVEVECDVDGLTQLASVLELLAPWLPGRTTRQEPVARAVPTAGVPSASPATGSKPARLRRGERQRVIADWMRSVGRPVTPMEIFQRFDATFPSYAAVSQWISDLVARAGSTIVRASRGRYEAKRGELALPPETFRRPEVACAR